ncbi:hypothetical protein CEW87_11555 [Parazoarcus communis]|uniref:Succinate dehydrogenase n=1 Tax=Parazoarcus communis TaxID=41977 RepID=A0A2U8H2Y3_9RHOO|nr:hypothetical protein [Parazoarcus communis]AWI79943.1 hypothetical protein CEW87_11555 [Parazoarcus communis]
MRTFQVLMLTLCLVGGLHLLLQAPEFFLPDRWDPAFGRQFDATASRVLGGGLLAMAAMALIFLRHHFYAEVRRLPGAAMQKIYFGLVLMALGLITLAFNLADLVPNPDRAPSASIQR